MGTGGWPANACTLTGPPAWPVGSEQAVAAVPEGETPDPGLLRSPLPRSPSGCWHLPGLFGACPPPDLLARERLAACHTQSLPLAPVLQLLWPTSPTCARGSSQHNTRPPPPAGSSGHREPPSCLACGTARGSPRERGCGVGWHRPGGPWEEPDVPGAFLVGGGQPPPPRGPWTGLLLQPPDRLSSLPLLSQHHALSRSTSPRAPRGSPTTAGTGTPSSSASVCRRTPSCCAGSCRCPRGEALSAATHRSPCAYPLQAPPCPPRASVGLVLGPGGSLLRVQPTRLLLSSRHFSYGAPPVINPLGTQFPSNTSVRPSYNRTLILGAALQNSTSLNLTSPAAGDWFLAAHLPESTGKIEVKVSKSLGARARGKKPPTLTPGADDPHFMRVGASVSGALQGHNLGGDWGGEGSTACCQGLQNGLMGRPPEPCFLLAGLLHPMPLRVPARPLCAAPG